jgi:hypothetical protein
MLRFVLSLFFLQNIINAASVTKCKKDTDCHDKINEYYNCQNVSSQPTPICVHKPVFPMELNEVAGCFVFLFFKLFSTTGGIGGGGVTTPVAMYFFKLDTKSAIALSSFAIAISTLATYLFNFNLRHPEKPKTVVLDYGLSIVMMPGVLVGSIIGSFFLVAMPDLAI